MNFEELEKISLYIRKEISDGNIDKGLNTIESLIKASGYEEFYLNDVILLKSQYKFERNNFKLGLKNENYSQNRIILASLELLDDIRRRVADNLMMQTINENYRNINTLKSMMSQLSPKSNEYIKRNDSLDQIIKSIVEFEYLFSSKLLKNESLQLQISAIEYLSGINNITDNGFYVLWSEISQLIFKVDQQTLTQLEGNYLAMIKILGINRNKIDKNRFNDITEYIIIYRKFFYHSKFGKENIRNLDYQEVNKLRIKAIGK
jgi:hypothetical protein